MTQRYQSLDEALTALEAGALAGDCRLVVSWAWWDALSETERNAYRARCEARRVRASTSVWWPMRATPSRRPSELRQP